MRANDIPYKHVEYILWWTTVQHEASSTYLVDKVHQSLINFSPNMNLMHELPTNTVKFYVSGLSFNTVLSISELGVMQNISKKQSESKHHRKDRIVKVTDWNAVQHSDIRCKNPVVRNCSGKLWSSSIWLLYKNTHFSIHIHCNAMQKYATSKCIKLSLSICSDFQKPN